MDAISFIAEQRICEAEKKGDFKNIPGHGKPLHLEDDSHIPPELRMAFKIMKNAGYVPPEVEDRKEIQTIVDLLDNTSDEQEKLRQMRKLDVVMKRVASRRGSALAFDEDDPYYQSIVDRISVAKRS
ncbi:MAG: DnaJ family domain-containing protein [Pseudomonadota bacterium]